MERYCLIAIVEISLVNSGVKLHCWVDILSYKRFLVQNIIKYKKNIKVPWYIFRSWKSVIKKSHVYNIFCSKKCWLIKMLGQKRWVQKKDLSGPSPTWPNTLGPYHTLLTTPDCLYFFYWPNLKYQDPLFLPPSIFTPS